jgi:putative membrane-bound dehydrogenase-like protein
VLAEFQVKPGFRLELVAAEPMVVAPVAMAFDENGRLFVLENRGSAEGPNEEPGLGRVRLLEDMDEEGAFRSSTVYAEDLPGASAVTCYAGGIFVGSGTNITYLKDTKGAGVADVRQTVLTGFGDTNAPHAAALNNFNWGLDDRIHAATAGLGGVVSAPNWPQNGPVSIAESDFAFDPRGLAVFPEAGPAQSGLTFDNLGRRFTCDFTQPLRLTAYEPRYANRNPYFLRLPAMADLLGPMTQIFRFVPRESSKPVGARPVSTAAFASAPAETYALAAGLFTRARGCVVYRGSAFPAAYRENVFIADSEAHLIHRAVLAENGLLASASRAPEERRTEFVLSKDQSFHPVQLINGPDGALYVADRQDGGERGRIFRIVPAGFRRPKAPQFAQAKTYDLVAALAQPDGWHQNTAARLLFERGDPKAVALLTNMARSARLPLARLQALHALPGVGALPEGAVLRGLRDDDALVREHAVLLAEGLVTNGVISDELWGTLKGLATDASARVRYQLAFTVGDIRRPERALVLGEILKRDFHDIWVQNAVFSSLSEGAANLFVLLGGMPAMWTEPGGPDFLARLATMIGTKGQIDDVTLVLNFIDRTQLDRGQAFRLLYCLGEGLHRTQSSLSLVDPQNKLTRFYMQAVDAMGDEGAPVATRVDAVRLLGVGPSTYADVGSWLLLLCDPRQNAAVQAAALTAMGHYNDPQIMSDLLKRWGALGPAMRRQAVTALLSRNERIGPLLSALEQGRIAAADFSEPQMNFLRTHHDLAVSERARRLLGPVPVRRPEAVRQFQSALKLKGFADRGRATFRARCADCHEHGAESRAFGPDLAGVRSLGKDKLLTAILEPNTDVAPDYATCVAQTKTGENLLGLKCDESLATLTLQPPDGTKAVWARMDLESVRTETWSLMPSGLEQGLSPQDMADLLEYLVAPGSEAVK